MFGSDARHPLGGDAKGFVVRLLVVIPRVCTVILFLFIIFISPIVVLHQLGIKANFDPHTVTPTQIINYISTVNSPFLLISHHHNKTKHTILGQHIHSPTQYVKKKKKENLAAQHPQSSTHQTKATKPTFSKPPTLHSIIKKRKKKQQKNPSSPTCQVTVQPNSYIGDHQP